MSRSKKKMAVLTSLQGNGEYIVTRKDCLLIRDSCYEKIYAKENKIEGKDRERLLSISRVFNMLANQ